LSSKDKGWKNRKKIIDFFECNGYSVDVVEKTNRFASPKDMYGLFDIICIKDKEVIFVQVSTNTPHSHHLLCDFSKKHASNILKIEQYTIKDKKRNEVRVVKKFQYLEDGTYLTSTIEVKEDE
jgi:hypothetical protein